VKCDSKNLVSQLSTTDELCPIIIITSLNYLLAKLGKKELWKLVK